MHNARLGELVDYPFQRLRTLLDGVRAGTEPTIDLAIGELRHAAPPMVAATLARAAAGWGKYPPTEGTPALRQAIAVWLTRRFALAPGLIDAERNVLVVAGTREALFMAALVATPRQKGRRWTAVLMPNPLYQVYFGAAIAAGAEPILLPADKASGYQPDLGALPSELLDRTALVYLNSPANPQGSVLARDRLAQALALARRHDFVLAVDECYSEIYTSAQPPMGALEAAGGALDHLLVFHSLSKRSNVPGLRSGFVAGDEALITLFKRLRHYGGAQVPLPVQEASLALWQDETHVAENRALYRAKFELAAATLGPAGAPPGGGFYLWLEVGDGEAIARRLWAEAGLRVMPGAYMARTDAAGRNPGAGHIRVALVDDLATTRTALERLRPILVQAGAQSVRAP